MSTCKYMAGWDDIFIGTYVSTVIHHILRTARILWNFSIHTDRTIQANKLDINIKDHKEKTCKLIDFTFLDINISAKEFEKLWKYKDLQLEVVDALGLVKKGTAKHLEKIPCKQTLAEIQKNST